MLFTSTFKLLFSYIQVLIKEWDNLDGALGFGDPEIWYAIFVNLIFVILTLY